MKLLTEADLAEILSCTEEKAREWRNRYGWPHIKIGRQIRFSEADVRAIQQMQSVAGKKVTTLPGQTEKSASRKKAS